MTSIGQSLENLSSPTLPALRDLALQVAEMAGRLSGGVAYGLRPDAAPEDARSVAARLIQQCGHRVVRAQSSYADGPHEFNDPLLDRLHTQLLARGGEVRMLVTGTLLQDEEALAKLTELATAGAQIRVSPCGLPTAVITDGLVGLLASERNAPLTVISGREAVRAISLLHDAVWTQSTGLVPDHRGWTADECSVRVLQAISQGYTDERAARELGLSVRTYRRHVAALLTRLDAGSRFQAGVRAAQLGLIGAAA
ncbi:LuxR C-terminal-related transcriptional regulator [Kitasatospora sp. NPDC001132]